MSDFIDAIAAQMNWFGASLVVIAVVTGVVGLTLHFGV